MYVEGALVTEQSTVHIIRTFISCQIHTALLHVRTNGFATHTTEVTPETTSGQFIKCIQISPIYHNPYPTLKFGEIAQYQNFILRVLRLPVKRSGH